MQTSPVKKLVSAKWRGYVLCIYQECDGRQMTGVRKETIS